VTKLPKLIGIALLASLLAYWLDNRPAATSFANIHPVNEPIGIIQETVYVPHDLQQPARPWLIDRRQHGKLVQVCGQMWNAAINRVEYQCVQVTGKKEED
jgi:hypothetical protein